MGDLAVFLILLGVGFTTGTILEKRHFSSIRKREASLRAMPVVTMERAYEKESDVEAVFLAVGECVVALDYFKMILAGLKGIIGGRLGSYETLVDRGRREAVLRMKEKAQRAGCDMIINMRIETSSIGQNANQKNGFGCVEVVAYGTAVKLKK